MKTFKKVENGAIYHFDSGEVIKELEDGSKVVIPNFTETAKKIISIVEGRASDSTKRKFGLEVKTKKTKKKKNKGK